MLYRIEYARRRVRCATCGAMVGAGEIEFGERHSDANHRHHHLRCAIAAIADRVAVAVNLAGAGGIEPGLELDREELGRSLGLARDAQRKVRRERYAALLVAEAGSDDVLDELARDLMTQLEADPHDASVLAVLADMLQDRGDPRGELITVQLALAATPGDAALMRRRDELIAKLAPVLDQGERCTWGLGFVRRAELAVRQGTRLGALAALWRHPSMRLTTEVAIELAMPYDAVALDAALAGVRRTLTSFTLATAQHVAIAGVVAALPRLRELALGDNADFERLAHPELRRLVVTSPATRDLVTALESPARVVRGPGDAPATRAHDVVEALAPAALPAVVELALRGTAGATDAVCERLHERGWLQRLERLALVDGTLGERGANALAVGLAGRRLARLDVTGNTLRPAARRVLAGVCDELVAPHALAGDGPVYVEHVNKPAWGRGTVVRRYDDKLEVEFPAVGRKVFKADAAFLKLSE